MDSFASLLTEVRNCTICAPHLPHGVRPVFQVHHKARVLVAGQAPGRKVHETGIPFNDASGNRLREWMGVTSEVFYNPKQIAILPMGFCFPGTGKFGDLPPRPECAAAWRAKILSHLDNIKIMLIIGQYAQTYHISKRLASLTETVKAWQSYYPKIIPLPHPSPRNNIWLKRNLWFEQELLPKLRQQISLVLKQDVD